MALHFGSVSLISPLTNLLGLWAVTLCFASGACVALLGLLLPALAGLLSWFPSLFVAYLRGLVRMLARIPLSCVYTSANPCLWVWLCFLYAIILLCKKFGPPKSVLRPVCCSIITLCLAVAVPIIASRSAQYDFQMLDVGQGQSILLTSGSTSALIDCGGSDADTAGDLAAQVCQTRGEYALDLLILTHYDDDHAGGTEQLLRRLKIKTICLPDNGAEPQRQAEIQLAAEAAGCQVRTISRDETILFGQGRLRLYAPEKDGNENSCMAVLASFHQTDFFITGDMNQQAEQNLLDRTGLCDAEYLVAGHHGSKYSTGEALLKAIRPGAVLISVGKNSYGHPAEETLGRIRAAGAACYRTDQCGTIRIRG